MQRIHSTGMLIGVDDWLLSYGWHSCSDEYQLQSFFDICLKIPLNSIANHLTSPKIAKGSFLFRAVTLQ